MSSISTDIQKETEQNIPNEPQDQTKKLEKQKHQVAVENFGITIQLVGGSDWTPEILTCRNQAMHSPGDSVELTMEFSKFQFLSFEEEEQSWR